MENNPLSIMLLPQDQLKVNELIQITKDEIVRLIITDLTPEIVAIVNQYKGQLSILESILQNAQTP
jgi:hypothetical protein